MSGVALSRDAAPPRGVADLARSLGGPVFVLALLLAWVSTQPFRANEWVEVETTENVVNQIAFSGMALLTVGCAVLSGSASAARAYLRPLWLLLIGWMAYGVWQSFNYEVSLRAFRFTIVVMAIAGAAMLLPRGLRQFARLLATAALIVLFLCYAGLVLKPSAAMHTAGDLLEPGHAGGWRGLYDHKNVAGPVMVVLMLSGLFIWKVGERGLGLAVALPAAIFLFFTGSKTSMALGPFVVVVNWLCSRTRSVVLRALIALGPLAVLLAITLGSAASPRIAALLERVSPGQTFTGRTEIWRFAMDRIGLNGLAGFGFEGFWGTPLVLFAEPKENELGIANGMVHAHNGYLDLALGLGMPGLVLAVLVLIWLPLRDHLRVRPWPENRLFADYLFGIWLFALYAACLESFFFRRADPVWFAMLLAILGLRLASRYRVEP